MTDWSSVCLATKSPRHRRRLGGNPGARPSIFEKRTSIYQFLPHFPPPNVGFPLRYFDKSTTVVRGLVRLPRNGHHSTFILQTHIINVADGNLLIYWCFITLAINRLS